MKMTLRRALAFCLLLCVGGALTGCNSLVEEDPNEQAVPWSQPAEWEGKVPGMPTR